MTEPIILSSASLRCEIKPEPGGCIVGQWMGETAVLRSTPVSDRVSVRHAGSYPLMQNNGPDPHAIHGLDWQRPWQVLDQEEKLLMLACEHQTDACWPFAFDAAQNFRIHGNELELTLSMSDRAGQPYQQRAGTGCAEELGIQILAPGESMSAQMSVQMERVQ